MRKSYKFVTFIAAILFFSCSGKRADLLRNPASLAPEESANENVFGGGATVTGKGAFSVPTSEGLVMRLQNGLDGNAKATAGNFARAFGQVKKNLPQLANPIKATGFDQVQLLVFGACSDLTTGTTPLMFSKYAVDPKLSITANQNSLVSAGLRMLDRHTAGLASQSLAAPKIKAALTNLTTQLSVNGGNTSIIAFMSVCIAANTVGSSLLGF